MLNLSEIDINHIWKSFPKKTFCPFAGGVPFAAIDTAGTAWPPPGAGRTVGEGI
jgi:hypothetical protein